MKVVLFCGGLGMRIREYSEHIPKPMVPIGYRPILWHVMRYYAHFGHNDFILCLGYKGDIIKRFFMEYDEYVSNDFVLTGGNQHVELLNIDISQWRITFVDTGLGATPGERLRSVREHLDGDEMFLANYSDGLSDLHLPDVIERAQHTDAAVTCLSVRPSATFHTLNVGDNGVVEDVKDARDGHLRINGGFFACRQEVFDYLGQGDDLVVDAFPRLIKDRKLAAYRYDGFWVSMDTFKEKEALDGMYSRGQAPWELWKEPGGAALADP